MLFFVCMFLYIISISLVIVLFQSLSLHHRIMRRLDAICILNGCMFVLFGFSFFF